MSHFSVLVITEPGVDPDEAVHAALAPYQENNMGDCPEEYLKFDDKEPEYREKYETGARTMVELSNGDRFSEWDKQFQQPVGNETGIFARTQFVLPEGARLINVPFKEEYTSFEQFMEDYSGYEKDPETGKYGYWENPNAKWDWWTIGGRWGGYFTPKMTTNDQGEFVVAEGKLGSPSTFDLLHGDKRDHSKIDQGRKGDIDFEGMRAEAADKALKQYRLAASLFGGTIPLLEYKWSDVLDNEKFGATVDEQRQFYWNQPALVRLEEIQKYCRSLREGNALAGAVEEGIAYKEIPPMTAEERETVRWMDLSDYQCSEEEYVKAAYNSAISTYAVVKDGKWYQRGEMGWWGMASNEISQEEWNQKFTDLLDGLSDDHVLTVVDCHI